MEQKFESISQLSGMIPGLDRAELKPVAVNSHRPESYVAVWNTSRDQLEAIVPRDKSTLVQHQDIFNSFVRAALDKGFSDANGIMKNQGGRVIVESYFAKAKINDGKSDIFFGVRLDNNYSRRSGPTLNLTAFGWRQICSNRAFLNKVVRYSKKHISVAETDKTVIALLDIVTNNMEQVKRIIDTAQGDVFEDTRDMEEAMLGELRSKKKVKRMRELFESQDDMSRYTVYNAITNYATHEAASEEERMRMQRIAEKILITPVARLKRQPWENE